MTFFAFGNLFGGTLTLVGALLFLFAFREKNYEPDRTRKKPSRWEKFLFTPKKFHNGPRFFNSKYHSYPIEVTKDGISLHCGDKVGYQNLYIEKCNIDRIRFDVDYNYVFTLHPIGNPLYTTIAKIYIETKEPKNELEVYGRWNLLSDISPLFEKLRENFGSDFKISPKETVDFHVNKYKRHYEDMVYKIIVLAAVLIFIFSTPLFLLLYNSLTN